MKAAQSRLESGDVNGVLIWVRPQETDEIKLAFDQTLAVRKLNAQAQALADRSFLRNSAFAYIALEKTRRIRA